ncbi:MAG: hypothetical protein A2Z20_08095 [Bdellovibrionales bacterium RBG_16_40_8]|nr:MAG: hypothetical protein A2Z20_08095 [Bdellovibrionales bacterium RBG_16_40_8]
MELSASYGMRTAAIDEDNYSKSESQTGSFAWYFIEMSALEFSYTRGRGTQSLKASGDLGPTIYYVDLEAIGADLIVTLAAKTSLFQPYVSGGVAKIKKKIYKEDYTGAISNFGQPIDDVVPSYGAGIKINLTQAFNLKFSYNRRKSGSSSDTTWDDEIRSGASWYF